MVHGSRYTAALGKPRDLSPVFAYGSPPRQLSTQPSPQVSGVRPREFVLDRFLISFARSGFKICQNVCRLSPSF